MRYKEEQKGEWKREKEERLGQWQQLIRITKIETSSVAQSEDIQHNSTWSICGERKVIIL